MSSGNSSLDGGPNSESLTRSYSVSTAERIRDNIPSRDYDGLKSQCDKAMHELQLLRRQHSETVRRCEHTMKELEYYRGQHHAAMAQLETAAQESSSLRTKYGELVSDLRSSQEGENGNGDAVNQLYLSTLSKYETIKEDYDDLRKRYEDLISNHSSAVNKLELAQEEVGRIKKQCEEMIAERNVAVRERNGLKQQCTAAIRQWDIALRERNEYQEALHKVQQQHEEAVKEVNQAMAVRMKASKDLKRLTEERNAALQEYSLIMSERDTVHKEMEKLSEDLSQAYLKNKAIEAEAKQIAEEKKTLTYQVETLKREIASALQDRDKALKECNDLRQRGGEFKERSQEVKTRYDSAYRERDTGRKDHREAQSSSMDLFGKCQKERMDNLDQANQEIDRLSKQVDKLQAELSESFQEAEVCKRRRDWAFSERDKIVMERESIRTLCDRLRKERDRAVSDLAEALRDSDDINKQRAETNKQLKVLKEKMEAQLEKENRMVQLRTTVDHNYSHDSAIDTDMQEYDSEMLSIDINGLSSTEDLGVELAEGRDDPQNPNDTGIYVTSVIKGSVADGKLKPNDCIVRVNNVDCRNVSKRFVLETMKSSGSTAVMVVRRRRLYTAQLNKYDHGVSLESGIYISKIMPGSLAARDGSLAVGDRVVSINNKAVEGLSAREVTSLLNVSSDTLLITTIKSGAVAITSRQSVASTQTPPTGSASLFIERASSSDENDHAELRPARVLKWPREPSEEKKRNRNSSPITIEQETDDALAELDSVIDTYHSSKGTVRRRTKHDRNGGTWPKASAGPFIEAGTGTIKHTRKNKERLPLPILMKSGGYSVRDYYNPNENRRPETIDLSVKSGNVEKEVLEYYVKRKSGIDAPRDDRTISPVGGGSPSPSAEVHSRIHSQLYGSPHFTPHPSFIHPHPHSHQSPPPPSYLPAEAAVRNSGLTAPPIYRLHLHSPSVDSQYHKARTLGSSSHHGGGHTSDDGGESSASSSYHHHHYEVATLPSRKRENQRFRIPSNPSVSSGKMSTGSIEKTSERASPMSFQIEILSELKSPGTSQKTSSLPDYYWAHKTSRGALRRVHIDKSAEPLGIQISCPKSGGVFVSTVSENSLASQVGLRVGDQLLEVCGINMRSATYQLAASVLRQCGNSITMLVQYSPDKLEGTGSTSSGDSKTRSGSPTPCNSPGAMRKSTLSGHLSPLSISHSSTFPNDEPRVLRIETHNKCSNLGISLVGGNAVGIFVHSVQMGSLAYTSGLRTGDRILEYNSTDLRSATAEEAAYELAKPADKVVVVAQYAIDRYNEIKDKPGDSFYIRALCDRSGELCDDVQLKFKKGDILFVDNTMFNGVPGSWRAYLVDESGHHHRCGIIPSKYKVEEEMVVKRSLGDLEGEARRATRRSFFRRKKHQRSDSKELASFSNTNLGWYSDSGTLNEETSFASYQRVNMLNYPAPRPVLIVGPLSDCVTEKLLQDFPDKFSRFYPEIMHCSQSTMEKGVADSLFVDYRKKGNFFECTTVSAIKDKCEKSVHCILEVSLAAVERLHRQQIYPIVLLIKFKSTKQIKEVKDSRYPSDKVTAKAAKEMYEHSLKLEQEYKHYISAVIHAGGVNIAYMCTQIKAAVDIEQKKILWVDANNQ